MPEGRAVDNAEPCRHCGEETTQRAGGEPYCSMECIGGRRRDLRRDTYRCPFDGCDWSHEYDPTLNLQVTVFQQKADKHREKHRPEEVEAVE